MAGAKRSVSVADEVIEVKVRVDAFLKSTSDWLFKLTCALVRDRLATDLRRNSRTTMCLVSKTTSASFSRASRDLWSKVFAWSIKSHHSQPMRQADFMMRVCRFHRHYGWL